MSFDVDLHLPTSFLLEPALHPRRKLFFLPQSLSPHYRVANYKHLQWTSNGRFDRLGTVGQGGRRTHENYGKRYQDEKDCSVLLFGDHVGLECSGVQSARLRTSFPISDFGLWTLDFGPRRKLA